MTQARQRLLEKIARLNARIVAKLGTRVYQPYTKSGQENWDRLTAEITAMETEVNNLRHPAAACDTLVPS